MSQKGTLALISQSSEQCRVPAFRLLSHRLWKTALGVAVGGRSFVLPQTNALPLRASSQFIPGAHPDGQPSPAGEGLLRAPGRPLCSFLLAVCPGLIPFLIPASATSHV